MARLVRTQGRHGELLADILTDFPERFAALREGFLDRPAVKSVAASQDSAAPTPIRIERSWLHKGRVVLKFAGVDSISAAEGLRGAELLIPAADRVPLEEDAAYIGDLAGCRLVDRSQAGHPTIGTIRDVIRQENTTDLLVVIAPGGEEYWIPFAKAYRARVDLAGRLVEMNLPAGLLEINAPLSEAEKRAHRAAEETGEDP